jgi:hypothetical protein
VQLSPQHVAVADLASELDSDGAASVSDEASVVSSSAGGTESAISSTHSSVYGSHDPARRHSGGFDTEVELHPAGPEQLGPLLSHEDHISSPYERVSPPTQHDAYRRQPVPYSLFRSVLILCTREIAPSFLADDAKNGTDAELRIRRSSSMPTTNGFTFALA